MKNSERRRALIKAIAQEQISRFLRPRPE